MNIDEFLKWKSRHASAKVDDGFATEPFHSHLAAQSPNGILAFVCIFLHRLRQDLAVCRAIYDKPNPQLREAGLRFQISLLRRLRDGEAEGARSLRYEHMAEAEQNMLERAETVRRRAASREGLVPGTAE